jgi:hypothetical protein
VIGWGRCAELFSFDERGGPVHARGLGYRIASVRRRRNADRMSRRASNSTASSKFHPAVTEPQRPADYPTLGACSDVAAPGWRMR